MFQISWSNSQWKQLSFVNGEEIISVIDGELIKFEWNIFPGFFTMQLFDGVHKFMACFFAILGIPPDMCDRMSNDTAILPFVLGGLALRSSVRTSPSAFWASWADCLHMVHQSHPVVCPAGASPGRWHRHTSPRRFCAGCSGVGRSAGFRSPFMARPGHGGTGFLRTLTNSRLMPSQSGSGAGFALSNVPSHPLVRCDSQLFRTLLFRRLRLARRFCRCGRPIDAVGPCAVCARAGVSAGRGARETTNVTVCYLDLEAMNVQDGRRLEVIADELRHHGTQLAIDTTIVSVLFYDGMNLSGVRRATQSRLVVLATEVGGRWSTEALAVLRLLARAKARSDHACESATGLETSMVDGHFGSSSRVCFVCRARCMEGRIGLGVRGRSSTGRTIEGSVATLRATLAFVVIERTQPSKRVQRRNQPLGVV